MLVLGVNGFVDWRDAVPDNIDKKIEEVKEKGSIVGIAHPYQLGSPMCTGGRWEFNIKNWRNVDYMEIWHRSFSFDNYENDNALKLWTNLTRGTILPQHTAGIGTETKTADTTVAHILILTAKLTKKMQYAQ